MKNIQKFWEAQHTLILSSKNPAPIYTETAHISRQNMKTENETPNRAAIATYYHNTKPKTELKV
jgi:hypothetical protein